MSFNYSPLQESASKLIEKFGKAYTFTHIVQGAYNPATGTESTTVSTFIKNACVFDYSESDRGNDAILQGDRRMLCEAGTYSVGDTAPLSDGVYRVVSISEIKPADTVMAVNLQVRK